MTPKEKAQDLILKMSFETHKHNAKHCAWTAANEIKEELISTLSNDVSAPHAIYWEKVKKEILNYES
jgi:hypothetical protein